jgi:hypothetical protein
MSLVEAILDLDYYSDDARTCLHTPLNARLFNDCLPRTRSPAMGDAHTLVR